MATVAINDGNGMMAMPIMAESAMATAAIAQVEDDIQQSADRYDDVDYGSPPSSRSPTPSPRSSRSPTPSPRRDREASPALERRHPGDASWPGGPPADITCGLCGQIDLDTYECRACGTRGCGFCVPANLCRSCSAVPVAAWTATQSEDGLPCRGLSRHRRRRTWQSLPSLMAQIAISDGNLCHH